MTRQAWQGGCRLWRLGAKPALLSAVVLLWSGCDATESEGPPAAPEKISLAMTLEPLGALTAIAADQGFFSAEGVDVTTTRTYPSGKRALEGLLAGEVAAAPCAETPIVFCSFERNDFAIVATIGSSDDDARIVARKDRGIAEPKDLRGKRVATQRASAVHYFLHLFLLRHGMSEDDVTLSFLPAEDLPAALAEDRIDAFSMREPFTGEAESLLGKRAVVFSQPRLYVKTFDLVVSRKVIDENPEGVRRMLRALLRAERFAYDHRDEAIDVVAGRLNTDRNALAGAWDELDFRVSLGQELLPAMEDEARWAMESGLVEKRQMPNYLDFIYVGALEEIEPDRVTVID